MIEHTTNCIAAIRMDNVDAHVCPLAMHPFDPGDVVPDNSLESPGTCVAIVCETAHHFKSLCGVLEPAGQPSLTELTSLDATGSAAFSSEIDALVVAWATTTVSSNSPSLASIS